MKLLRSAVALALLGVLWGGSATAQSVSSPDKRLQQVGQFIGANDMVAALSQYCADDYSDASYDAQGILAKLKAFVRPDELALYADYFQSSEYFEAQRATREKVKHAFDGLSAQMRSAAQACRILIAETQNAYAAAKADLERLR